MYQDEESIKARLRALAGETRRLRHELDELVKSGASKDLTRGLARASGTPKADLPGVSHDRNPKPRRKKR